jgi:hypothetical protein
MSRAAAALVAVLLVLAAGPALADEGGGGFDWAGEKKNQGANVEVTQPGSNGQGYDTAPTSSGGGSYTPQPWTQERLVPFCMQSTINNNNDALCAGMFQSCPEDGESRWRVYQRRMSAENEPLSDWEQVGTRCEGPDTEEGVQEPEVTQQDVVDSAFAAAPVPDFVIEPADKSYVNVPTNFAATDDEPVTVTVQPLGIPVPVTFTPTSYRWDFGDGDTGSGAGVRNASVGAPGAVEHLYAASGSYDVTLTRVYTIAFTLPSGESVTIPGEVSATSEPQTLEVGEIQSTVTGVG